MSNLETEFRVLQVGDIFLCEGKNCNTLVKCMKTTLNKTPLGVKDPNHPINAVILETADHHYTRGEMVFLYDDEKVKKI